MVLESTLPQLVAIFHEDDNSRRGPALSALSGLIKAFRETFTGATASTEANAENPLSGHRDELLSVFSSGIESSSNGVKVAGLMGAESLVHIPNFLTKDEIVYLVDKTNEVLIESEPQSPRLVISAASQPML